MPNVTIKGSHTVTSYCDTFLDIVLYTEQYQEKGVQHDVENT